MKKVLGLAAAGLLAAGAAQAGTLTVANSDITLYGGVSAAYEYQNNDLVVGASPREDQFRITSFAIGLKKDADPNKSPIGFNAAFASFAVPTVVASVDVVNSGLIAYGNPNQFKPWLAYATIAPVEGLSIDAGLLWAKYGEAPLTILNPNINRGALFVYFNPVLFTGARINYDAGVAKVYAGYNQGNGLFQGGTYRSVNDAVELGATANLGIAKAGLHVYDEAGGYNFYTLCLKGDFGAAKAGVQISYATKDDKIKSATTDDNQFGIALNVDPSISEQIAVPIRIEYVNTDAKKDDTIWTFTVTPTWKPTKNTFARVELAYTSADAKLFGKVPNGTANTKDTRTVAAFEAGFLF